jgi:hypothetical protein
VTLLGFQRALADMVAAPPLARAVRAGDASVLDGYELTERERRRLETVAAQPGMEVNCTLYRANRLTPIVMLLPYTCFVLGDRMKTLAGRFWDRSRTDLQFRSETERFAAFLREQVESGELDEPLLEEVLAFELATNELRFLPRRQLEAAASSAAGERLRLHPLVRLIWFRHDPRDLLARLAATEPLPYSLEEGDFPLLLVAGPEELEVRLIDPQLARLLEALDDVPALAPDDMRLLVDEGLAVPA